MVIDVIINLSRRHKCILSVNRTDWIHTSHPMGCKILLEVIQFWDTTKRLSCSKTKTPTNPPIQPVKESSQGRCSQLSWLCGKQKDIWWDKVTHLPSYKVFWVLAIRALYYLFGPLPPTTTFFDPDRLVFSFLCLYIMEDTEFDVLVIGTSLTESIVAAYAIATHVISQRRN